jgi:L-ascorbate metabolism protein UlaG (beta-lactamase superfamily)
MADRFKNPEDQPHFRGIPNVIKWRLGFGQEPRKRSPRRAEVPVVANDGRALVGAPNAALTWIGHATFLAQINGLSILTDPVLSPRIAVVPRNVPPGLAYPALPKIDVVLLTHNHMDHLDLPTLKRLGKEPVYIVPKGVESFLRRRGFPHVRELGWWEHTTVGEVRFTFVPSQHWSRRGLLDEDKTLWGGYVVDGEKRLYHSGDTAYFGGFRDIGQRLGRIDAAMLPIGAYEPRWFMKAQHMNPDDAVQAFLDLGAERFFAMHWGTFKLTDEPILEPPARTRELWHERDNQLSREQLLIPAIGETILL